MTDPKPPVGPVQPYQRVWLTPVAIVCLAVVVVAVIAAFVVLSVTGSDASEFRSWLNTVLNFGGLLLGGTASAAAFSADRKAGKAAEQTNGGLDARIQAASAQAVAQALTEAGLPPVTPPGSDPITRTRTLED